MRMDHDAAGTASLVQTCVPSWLCYLLCSSANGCKVNVTSKLGYVFAWEAYTYLKRMERRGERKRKGRRGVPMVEEKWVGSPRRAGA